MSEFKKVLDRFGLKTVINSSRQELETLEKNLRFADEKILEDYINTNFDDLIYLLKGVELNEEELLEDYVALLDMVNGKKGENEQVYKLMKKMVLDKRVYGASIMDYYTSKSTRLKVEKLLDGLYYNDDLFLEKFFLQDLNEEGMKNYRKLYGNLPKTSLGLGFLNITDDKDFLNKLPEINSANQDIRTRCTLEELESFKDESLKDDYSFSFLLGHYNYKDYEDELIEFEKENKEFLKKIDAYIKSVEDIESFLKALNLLKKNEELRKKLFNKKSFSSGNLIVKFISDSFILGKTEDDVLKILKKALKKSFAIEGVYGTFDFSYFVIAYLGDVILKLNSCTNPTKLKNLCFLASLVGLKDERFKEALKSKVSAFGVEKIYRKISSEKQEEIFKKNFKMASEEFFLKSLRGVDPREEDLEKIKHLEDKGYRLVDIYDNLKSIDNIIYLIDNSYDIAWNFMGYVRPFFEKDDLDTIIKYSIGLPRLGRAYIYNYKEVIKEKILRPVC